jgi:hypothetical protein
MQKRILTRLAVLVTSGLAVATIGFGTVAAHAASASDGTHSATVQDVVPAGAASGTDTGSGIAVDLDGVRPLTEAEASDAASTDRLSTSASPADDTVPDPERHPATSAD